MTVGQEQQNAADRFFASRRVVDFESHDRRSTLGASEVAAVLGFRVSRFTDPHRVWMEKRGLLDRDEPTAPMIRGTAGEDMILAEFSRRNPDAFCSPCSRLTILDPVDTFASASPDMVVVWPSGTLSLVDAKWPGSRTIDEWGDPESGTPDAVPSRYYWQAVWQMKVCGVRTFVDFFLPFDIDSWEFRSYRVLWNREAEERITTAARDFWSRCVVGGEEPELDGSEGADAWIAKRFPALSSAGRDKNDKIDLRERDDLSNAAAELFRVKRDLERLDAERSRLEQLIKASIGDHYGAKLSGVATGATYYDSASVTTNWKALAESLGVDEETVAKYTTRKPYRVLRMSWAKDAESRA